MAAALGSASRISGLAGNHQGRLATNLLLKQGVDLRIHKLDVLFAFFAHCLIADELLHAQQGHSTLTLKGIADQVE